MITEKIAREKEVVAQSIEDALDLVNTDFLVKSTGADLKEIDISKDGTLSVGSLACPMTDWAFESLCQLLKIPVPFARSIPPELLLQNLNKLKEENNQRVTLLLSRDTVINVVPNPYHPAGNADMLLRLKKEVVPEMALELGDIRISDRGMEVSFLKEGVAVEPAPGDITRFGLRVSNSETGWRGAKAGFYLFRLVCTNGAIVSNNWGTAEWDYDYRISRERSLQNFIGQIIKLNVDFAKFEDSYNRLLDRELMAVEFVNVRRRMSRIVGNDNADRITRVSKEERNRLNAEYREGNRMLATGVILYDLYNNITDAAKTYPFVQRRALEMLGGSVIDLTGVDINGAGLFSD